MFPACAVVHNAHFVPIFFLAGGVNASAGVLFKFKIRCINFLPVSVLRMELVFTCLKLEKKIKLRYTLLLRKLTNRLAEHNYSASSYSYYTEVCTSMSSFQTMDFPNSMTWVLPESLHFTECRNIYNYYCQSKSIQFPY